VITLVGSGLRRAVEDIRPNWVQGAAAKLHRHRGAAP
jgi:hypothetical protein